MYVQSQVGSSLGTSDIPVPANANRGHGKKERTMLQCGLHAEYHNYQGVLRYYSLNVCGIQNRHQLTQHKLSLHVSFLPQKTIKKSTQRTPLDASEVSLKYSVNVVAPALVYKSSVTTQKCIAC